MVAVLAKCRFMDLPTELRLDIYERLLRWDYPIKRMKPIDKLDGTDEDEMRQYVRGDFLNVSILFACKTTYEEALPILYRQNVMSLAHGDMCKLELERIGRFTRCDANLLTRVVVVDWLECTPWTTCKHCSINALTFLNGFSPFYFPKLKAVMLDLELFPGGYAALGEQILKSGVDVSFTFTAVGCLTIPGTKPAVELRFTSIAETWRYYSQFPPRHFELHRRSPVAAHLQGIEPRFVRYVREIIWKYYEYVAADQSAVVLSEAQGMLKGVDLRWLNPEKAGSGVYEKLTDKLIQRMEALARRR